MIPELACLVCVLLVACVCPGTMTKHMGCCLAARGTNMTIMKAINGGLGYRASNPSRGHESSMQCACHCASKATALRVKFAVLAGKSETLNGSVRNRCYIGAGQ